MAVLSVNAGSSSLKISLYAQNPPCELILTCSISNISSPPAQFSFTSTHSSTKDEHLSSIKDHASAFSHFLDHLTQEHREHIAHVCHRVVHGGDYSHPVVISKEEYHHIAMLSDLAPLHNSAALSVITACINALPTANSIAFFDTAFHRSIPPHISTYPLDQTMAKQKGLKKYGFHGLSYAFILRSVARYLQQPQTSLNLIVMHLGSGASVCAIKQGHSLDTSMGLTPLDGLPGATRSGAIDPSLIFHYTNKAGKMSHHSTSTRDLHITEAEDILNRKSGWKALTGTTDFKEITTRANLSSPDDPNPDRLAFDLFADRVLNYVGAYFLKLDGHVDALVFSGGIGERSKELRSTVGERVRCLGFSGVDGKKNEGVDVEHGVVVDIDQNADGARGKRILVCRTDEQLEMARQCALENKFWEE